ncbi:MAG: ATP-binding protein [Flavobacteriaceae bacterium]
MSSSRLSLPGLVAAAEFAVPFVCGGLGVASVTLFDGAAATMGLVAALAGVAGCVAAEVSRAGSGTDTVDLLPAGHFRARFLRNGDVAEVSPEVAALLGLETGDLAGSGLLQRLHLADRPAFLAAVDAAAAEGSPAQLVCRIRATSGAYRSFTVAMCFADGAVRAIFGDVTQLRDAEDALAAEHARIAEVDAARTRLLANVSHELRTPLNAIIGFAEVLETQPFGEVGEARTREYAGLIRDSGRHLLDLVNGILDMSKLQAGEFAIFPEPCDIVALARKCGAMVGPSAAERALQIGYDFPEGMPELNADPRACRQIILNLLSNAIKFSHRGGRVMIGAYSEAGDTVVYVADEGIGIAAADIERLGAPFVQVHGDYNSGHAGTGLGLSMVRGLAELHSGSMTIESCKGQGTRVTVRLPNAGPDVPLRGNGDTKIVQLRTA